MFSFILLIGCISHAKPKVVYTTIGVVDRHENGVCVIEIHEERFGEYITIFMKSDNCKDGDIIAIGRNNGTKD